MLSLGLGRFQVKINMFFNLFFMQKTPKELYLLSYPLTDLFYFYKESSVLKIVMWCTCVTVILLRVPGGYLTASVRTKLGARAIVNWDIY